MFDPLDWMLEADHTATISYNFPPRWIANRSLSNDPPSINTTGQSLSLFKLNYPDPSNDTTATPMPLPLWHLQICWGSRSWSLHEQHVRHCFYLDHSRQLVFQDKQLNAQSSFFKSAGHVGFDWLVCLFLSTDSPNLQIDLIDSHLRSWEISIIIK